MELFQITDELVDALEGLCFGPPVTHVYNPLVYARASHNQYLKKYGKRRREIILLGMNPGPWGMAQNGVPFGEIGLVRDWLGIREAVDKPSREHPKRPIEGFDCTRSEVSGARLWGWARDRFGTPKEFFRRFYIANFCPLCFMEESGRNRTPDKLPAQERQPLLDACDEALRRTVGYFRPRHVIGVGNFAEKRAQTALDGFDISIGRIPHPSPASPTANRGWSEAAEAAFERCGIQL